MHGTDWSQVVKDPRFTTIIRRKWLLNFGLSAAMMIIYAAYVLIMILAPQWLLPALSPSNPFNVGLLLTLILLLFIMVAMIGFLLLRGNDTHADIHRFIAQHRDENSATDA